jgi:hypothetical protein
MEADFTDPIVARRSRGATIFGGHHLARFSVHALCYVLREKRKILVVIGSRSYSLE